MDIYKLDFNGMYIKRSRKFTASQNSDKWNKLAAKLDVWAKKEEEYPKTLLSVLKPHKDWTVLDIGCGTGILSIPIAKQVKSVTALDISPEMLNFLKANAEAEKLNNIMYINKPWDEAKYKKDIDKYDVVIASRVPIMDPKKELAKMNSVARRYIYLTSRASIRSFNKSVYEALGRPFREYPTHIHLYNILFQMGILANVKLIEVNGQIRYQNIEEAMDYWCWEINDLRPDEEEFLMEYLLKNLTKTREGTLEGPPEMKTWALIWWKKQEPLLMPDNGM